MFTSPPYWDTEHYGDEPQQLGLGKTYQEFLEGLGQLISEAVRVLKPGRFLALDVNDFTRRGEFYAFHLDTWGLMLKAGLEAWDVGILDGATRPLRCTPGASWSARGSPSGTNTCWWAGSQRVRRNKIRLEV